MRLSNEAVFFTFGGIPILGSMVSGDVIGLSPAGQALCSRMKTDDVCRAEIDAVDLHLAAALEKGAFLQGSERPARRAPRSAYVHVTQRCNLSCVGCYSLDGKRNKLEDAPVARFAMAFARLASIGVREIVISGGEPFLRGDLPALCDSAKAGGIEQITVITNGTLVTRDALEGIAPFVDCVSVSFDGVSQASPAHIRGNQRFSDLVNAIKLIEQSGIQAHMIPTIHRLNYADMGKYLELSRELGASLNFSLLSCCDSADALCGHLVPDDHELLDMGKAVFEVGKTSPVGALDLPVGSNLSVRRRCGAAVSTLSVDADGAVYPCHMLHHPQLAMGSIFDEEISEILASDTAQLLSQMDVKRIEECVHCEYVYLCGGGCRARAFAQTGDLAAKDPFCPMTHEFYRNVETELKAAYA